MITVRIGPRSYSVPSLEMRRAALELAEIVRATAALPLHTPRPIVEACADLIATKRAALKGAL